MLIKNLLNTLSTQEIKKHLKPEKNTIALSTALGVFANIAQLAGFYYLMLFLIEVNWTRFFAMLMFWLGSAISTSLSSFFAHRAETRFCLALKQNLINHLSLLSSSVRKQYDEETLKRLLKDDVQALHHTIAHLPAELCTFIVLPTLSLLLLIKLTGFNALLTLIPASLASIYYLLIVPKTTARDGEARMNVMYDMVSAVNDYCRGVKVDRIYGQSSSALNKYLISSQSFSQRMSYWVKKVASLAAIATALLQPVATLTIAYGIAYDESLSILASTLFFSLAFVTPVLKLGHGLDYIQQGIQAAQRIAHFLTIPTYANGVLEARPRPNQGVELLICCDHLKDNKQINPSPMLCCAKEITSLMGVSGSGKSTLLKTITGFELIPPKAIYFDRLDVADLNRAFIHHWVSLMPQTLHLMSGSIENNINYLMPHVEHKKIQDILYHFDFHLPLNTQVQHLSGGERQRILMAITLVSPAPIILLDEATSAINHNLARRIMFFLKNYAVKHNKTIVLVTHDQEIANLADKNYIISVYDESRNNKGSHND